VIAQLLTESVLLALAGGALGIFIAAWSTAAAIKVLPDALPRAGEIHLDFRVLLFTLAASVVSGLLFGLAPALKTSDVGISETLKEGGRGGSGTRHRTQSVFVGLEMAMAVVLLVAAGLMIRSLANLWSTNPGFDVQNVVNFRIATAQPLGATPAAIRAAFRNLHDAVSSVPGVEAMAVSDGSAPMEGDSDVPFWLEGEHPAETWTLFDGERRRERTAGDGDRRTVREIVFPRAGSHRALREPGHSQHEGAGGRRGGAYQTVGAEPGRDGDVAGAVLPALGAAAGFAAFGFFSRSADGGADSRDANFYDG
jgi:hypothetical protein